MMENAPLNIDIGNYYWLPLPCLAFLWNKSVVYKIIFAHLFSFSPTHYSVVSYNPSRNLGICSLALSMPLLYLNLFETLCVFIITINCFVIISINGVLQPSLIHFPPALRAKMLGENQKKEHRSFYSFFSFRFVVRLSIRLVFLRLAAWDTIPSVGQSTYWFSLKANLKEKDIISWCFILTLWSNTAFRLRFFL